MAEALLLLGRPPKTWGPAPFASAPLLFLSRLGRHGHRHHPIARRPRELDDLRVQRAQIRLIAELAHRVQL